MVWCSRIPGLSAHGKAALARLADICDPYGKPLQTLSQNIIANDCGFSTATLKRCLTELEEMKLITRTSTGPERNYRCDYTVNWEGLLTFVPDKKKFALYENKNPDTGDLAITQAEPALGSLGPVDRSNHGRTETNYTNYTNTKRYKNNAQQSHSFEDHSEADRNARIAKALVAWIINGSSYEKDFVEPGRVNFDVGHGAMTAAHYALSALKENAASTIGTTGHRIHSIMDALELDRGAVGIRCAALLKACSVPVPNV